MNPIDYIEKCTLEDLLEYRKGTVSLDKNKIERNNTRWEDLVLIAYKYLGYADWKIAKEFGKSVQTIKSQKFKGLEKWTKNSDELDDLLRELGYWKYKQLNNLNGSKN